MLKLPIWFLKKSSDYTGATGICNTGIERKFCGLSEDNFENCQKLCYSTVSNFLDIGKFEVNILYMEVTLVYDHQNAYNTISLTSSLY